MACVNESSPEFQSLLENSGINQHILAAKVTVWQELNGVENFPTLEQLGLTEKSSDRIFKESLTEDSQDINQLTNIAEDNFAHWSSETNESEDPFLC